MSRTSRSRLIALLGAAGLLVGGCGGSGEAAGSDGEHDHSGGITVLEAPEDRYAGIDLTDPYHRPSFTLTDTAGESFDFQAETAGRPTMLFFGFSRCPDICPTTLADIALALRKSPPAVAEQVRMVVVTTDPGYDTPEVLGEYLGRFDADLPAEFVGLTGSQEAIEQAQLSAGVPLAQENGQQHSSLVLLYGTDDEAHVAFDAGNTADDIAADLAEIVQP